MKIYEPKHYEVEMYDFEQKSIEDTIDTLKDLTIEMSRRSCSTLVGENESRLTIDDIRELIENLITINDTDYIYQREV